MANHPNRSRGKFSYFKVCPRGFSNENIYFRVLPNEVAEVEKYFEGYEDDGSGRHAGWTHDSRATMPGVAVNWADRAWVGLRG